jgi:hypothetical protein
VTRLTTAPSPEAPEGAVAITDFHLLPPSSAPGTTLITLNVRQDVPDGYKANWYTYEDGEWTKLQSAAVIGGSTPVVQTSFATLPENVIVFALPS